MLAERGCSSVREPGGCSHACPKEHSVPCATAMPPCLSASLLQHSLLQILRNKGRLLCHLISPHILPIHLQEDEGNTCHSCRQSRLCAVPGQRQISLPALAGGRALQMLTHVTGSVLALGHRASACPGTSSVSFSSKPCFQLGLDAQIVPLLLEASS